MGSRSGGSPGPEGPALRLVLPVSLALACEPLGAARGPAPAPAGRLVASPAALDLGLVRVGEDAPTTATFTVENTSARPIVLSGHDEPLDRAGPVDGAFSVDAPGPALRLAPGERRRFTVTFDPPTDGAYEAELRLLPGAERLRLRGSADAPVLAVRAPSAAVAPYGCAARVAATLRNDGERPLLLDGLAVDGPGWSTSAPATAFTLAPGRSLAVDLVFAPAWGDDPAAPAALRFTTNDRLAPAVALPLTGLPLRGAARAEDFALRPPSAADLLIVAETDGVLDAHTDKLRAALPGLLDAFAAADADLHVAATTTGAACPAGDPAVVTPALPPDRRLRALLDALDAPADPAASVVDVAAAALAADTPGACLDGFRRARAPLAVLFVTGRPEPTGRDAAALDAALRAPAADALPLQVHAALNPTDTPCAGARYADGTAALVLRTGGVLIDLCAPDWTDGLAALADTTLAAARGPDRLVLAARPVRDSLAVTVGGAPTEDWAWIDAENAVLIDATDDRPAGTPVTVTYEAALDCPSE